MADAKGTEALSPARIVDDLWAALGTQALSAGIQLGVFDQIAGGKKAAKDIAKGCKASPRGINMLLDALTAMGYLNRKGENYGLEPISDKFLVRSKPSFIGDFALTTALTYSQWANLAEAVRSGKPIETVDQEERGKEFFPKLVPALFAGSYGASKAALAALPKKTVGGIKKVLDVAAGSGAWSIAFAEGNPDVNVTVVDLPEVTPITREFASKFGLTDQYEYKEGNLRELDFGRGAYDLVILGHIIHSEGEKWGKKLIAKSYRALKPGGLLLIAEMVPNDTRSGPKMPLLFGLNMLIHTTEGNVFTLKQYREWLKATGFSKVSTIEAPAPSPLILATK